jgi:hypothetical protein
MESPKSETRVMLGHVKEECVKDPLYMTKLLVSVFGKNIFTIIIRILAYVLVYYIATTYLGITKTVAGILVFAVIISYNSFKMILHKIRDGAKNGKQNIGDSSNNG